MTDLRKAAEVLLHEKLESVPKHARLVIDSEDGLSTRYIPVGIFCQQAAQALRQALAQPEQEPVAWVCRGVYSATGHCPECQPLYTAPPKREWVGLTDEDLKEARKACHGSGPSYRFAYWVESICKEKNT